MQVYKKGKYLFHGYYRNLYYAEVQNAIYIFCGEIIDKNEFCVLFVDIFGEYSVIYSDENGLKRRDILPSDKLFGNSIITYRNIRNIGILENATKVAIPLDLSEKVYYEIILENENIMILNGIGHYFIKHKNYYVYMSADLKNITKHSTIEIIDNKIYINGNFAKNLNHYPKNIPKIANCQIIIPPNFIPDFYYLRNYEFKKIIFTAFMCLKRRTIKNIALKILSYL